MAHQRAEVLDVDLHRRQVALPADGVERVVRIGHGGDRAAALDVDLPRLLPAVRRLLRAERLVHDRAVEHGGVEDRVAADQRSEEQTSELQYLMRNSYAVFCLKNNNKP